MVAVYRPPIPPLGCLFSFFLSFGQAHFATLSRAYVFTLRARAGAEGGAVSPRSDAGWCSAWRGRAHRRPCRHRVAREGKKKSGEPPQVHNQGMATFISILVKPMGQIRTPLPSQVAGAYTSGRRVLGGAPVRNELPPLAPRGRRPGEWRKLIVSVPGRCGTVYMVPRAVFPILHCESSSGQPRGARTACVLLLAAGAEWAFLIRNAHAISGSMSFFLS